MPHLALGQCCSDAADLLPGLAHSIFLCNDEYS